MITYALIGGLLFVSILRHSFRLDSKEYEYEECDNSIDDVEQHEEDAMPTYEPQHLDNVLKKTTPTQNQQIPNWNPMLLLSQNLDFNKQVKNLMVNVPDFTNPIAIISNTPATMSSSPSSSSNSSISSFNENPKKKSTSFSIDNLINNSDDKLKLSQSSVTIKKSTKNSKKLSDKHIDQIREHLSQNSNQTSQDKILNTSNNTSSSRSSSRLESANSSRCASPEEIVSSNLNSDLVGQSNMVQNFVPMSDQVSAAIRLRSQLSMLYSANGLPVSNFIVSNPNALACSSPIVQDQTHLVSALSAMSKTYQNPCFQQQQQQQFYNVMLMRAMASQHGGQNVNQFGQMMHNLSQATNQQKLNAQNVEQMNKILPLFLPMHS